MYGMTMFSKRINMLRTRYNLSYNKLANISSVNGVVRISSLSIRSWENGKHYVSAEGLYILSEIFGISIDWLLGICDTPYNEDVLDKKELEFNGEFPCARLGTMEIPIPLKYSESYKEGYLRRSSYSLQDRADLLYCIYTIRYEWEDFLNSRPYEFKYGVNLEKVQDLWDWLLQDSKNEFFKDVVDKYNRLMFEHNKVFDENL